MTLKEASLNLTEQEYRDLPELSYSALSRYDRDGYECLDTLFDPISSQSLTFGSLVDCLVTQPDEFPNQYLVGEIPVLSETMQAVAGYLLGEYNATTMIGITDEEIVSVADVLNIYPTYKNPTRVTKIREACTGYYNLMKQGEGKVVVASSVAYDATKAATTLMNDPITSQFLQPNEFFGNYDIFFQLQFKGVSPEGVPFKGMLDVVKVDHEKKIIYPCDLKTTKSIYTFEDSFYKYRYYLQAAMYTYLLKQVIKEKCPELQDYTIAPYRFICIDRKVFRPIIFIWNPENYEGTIMAPGVEPRKSWRELLVELNWNLQHRDVQLPQDWYNEVQAEGGITIKDYQLL